MGVRILEGGGGVREKGGSPEPPEPTLVTGLVGTGRPLPVALDDD